MADAPMKIYLVGPMTGIEEFNFPAFHAAAKRLRAEGHTVFNPAENDGGKADKPRAHYMRMDVRALVDCEAIMVLPGWLDSRGARLEVQIAVACDLPLYEADTGKLFRWKGAEFANVETLVLCAASLAVHGDRRVDYGHPADDFARTAKMWSALLDCEVSAAQVAMCMIAVKLSRECHRPKRGNLVDIAGYAECLAMVRLRD